MTIFIDRRHEPVRHKFGKDKARFLRRIRDAVKKAVQDKVADSPLAGIDKGGVKVPIPRKTTQEPVIHHAQGPVFRKVFPGNLYDVGDVVPIPPSGGGGGKGGKEGDPDAEDDEDAFVWVSEDEFLDIFFEGRTLPDMNKLHASSVSVMDRQRFGHTTKGPSHKMDMSVTNQKRKGEALVLNKTSERRILKNLLEQYQIYRTYRPDLPELDLDGKSKTETLEAIREVLGGLQSQFTLSANHAYKNPTLTAMFNCVEMLEEGLAHEVTDPEDVHRLEVLRKRIPEQKKTAENAKKFQSHHLTYRFDKEQPKPSAKAVMICKMDVSASMSQEDKNTAKAFFWLVSKFLENNYDEVDVVFISHTTTAMEVDEQEFFYGKRTGGTLVSSCLEKELEIIKDRYDPSEWNIYSAQASDGDNSYMDNDRVEELMREILPIQQSSYFMEVRDQTWEISDLHELYQSLTHEFPQLKTATVNSPGEAVEAFKSFFPVGGQAPAHEPAMV